MSFLCGNAFCADNRLGIGGAAKPLRSNGGGRAPRNPGKPDGLLASRNRQKVKNEALVYLPYKFTGKLYLVSVLIILCLVIFLILKKSQGTSD